MKKILIVDDSAFFRSLLKDELSKKAQLVQDNDLRIIEAHNSFSALQQIKRESPDLVFLDVVMPEGEQEGIKILEKIREEYPSVKVVMLTSDRHENILKQCRELGVQDYLIKPFESYQINTALKKHL